MTERDLSPQSAICCEMVTIELGDGLIVEAIPDPATAIVKHWSIVWSEAALMAGVEPWELRRRARRLLVALVGRSGRATIRFDQVRVPR